ncbi:MAG: sugar ABC transporter ATP-binding protein [Chloroflexi bacterium]|nr:MAG: sugar ABC transporter ATP-binding protein [Chloroflexota bacterium]
MTAKTSGQRLLSTLAQQLLVYSLLFVFGLAFLLPFLWTVSSSLKPPGAGFKFPPEFIPKEFVWENYPKVFEMIPFGMFFRNSLFVTGAALLGEIFSASLVAYAFARLRFPGRDALFLVLLATMMIPYPVTMVPTFILFKTLGWVNTYLPLILPPWFGPAFSIFLLRQFFLTINTELDEAAKVDGASEFLIYHRILLPLSKPALATVAIFGFVFYWNDFLNPLIYLSESSMYTLALGVNFLRSFRGGGELAVQMAASVMFVAPCIVLFLVAQRFVVEGIVTTGLKG